MQEKNSTSIHIYSPMTKRIHVIPAIMLNVLFYKRHWRFLVFFLCMGLVLSISSSHQILRYWHLLLFFFILFCLIQIPLTAYNIKIHITWCDVHLYKLIFAIALKDWTPGNVLTYQRQTRKKMSHRYICYIIQDNQFRQMIDTLQKFIGKAVGAQSVSLVTLVSQFWFNN